MNYAVWMKRSFYLVVLFPFLFLSGCDEDFEAPPEVTITDDFVDLRPRQSSIKNQGNRTTCIVFAGLAAVEAAYIRQGYGELELSPEFINFTRKAFYLHPLWDQMLERGPNGVETQLGSDGGGGGVGVVSNLNKGFKVPLTDVMPYHDSDNYYRDAYPALRSILDKIANGIPRTQREYSTFNLDSTILNNSILRHDKFYSVGNYRNIENPRDPAQFESALRRGYEVVWDFAGANPGDPGGRNNRGVWQRCDACGTIPHSMLIVGYDKRSSDTNDHYFIVKNSWGPVDDVPGSQGFTYISYDYVRSYGAGANYVTLVNPPQAWPELAFIGRWKLNFDGHRGELDIYHLPGMNQHTFEYNFGEGKIPEVYDDFRLGTYYDGQSNAYKVNGTVSGNRIDFYIDMAKPMLRWDELSGRKFTYYLDSLDLMAGYHRDGDGSVYGGYARKHGYIYSSVTTPVPVTADSYKSSKWELFSADYQGTVQIETDISAGSNVEYLLEGSYIPSDDSGKFPVQLKVPIGENNRVYMQIANMGDGTVGNYIGKLLSWDSGIISGHTPEIGDTSPFLLRRLPD